MNGVSIALVGVILLMGCASKEKQLAEKVEQSAKQLQHLSAYKEIECQIHVKLSEPSKTAWVQQLSRDKKAPIAKSLKTNESQRKLFVALENQTFTWRATPYRCRLLGEQTSKLSAAQELLLRDTEKKLETVMCVWMQGFYADSPLRGWKQSKAVLEEIGAQEGVRLDKGQDRALEIREDGKRITAVLGPSGGQLSGRYREVGGKLYPEQIEQSHGTSLNRLQEINYQDDLGRQLPAEFWLSLQQEGAAPPSAYLRAQFQDCKSR